MAIRMGEHATKKASKFSHASARRKAGALQYKLEAASLKALAHPKRLLILDLLSDGAERNVGQLVEDTGVSQTNLSQNLAVLRAAGLVATRREGNLVYYRVADERVVRAAALLRTAMVAPADDPRGVDGRAAAKREARLRKATLGAHLILGTLGMAALFAFTHPLLAGGSLSDAAQHAQMMLSSKSIGALIWTCLNAGHEMPTAAASMATVLAGA